MNKFTFTIYKKQNTNIYPPFKPQRFQKITNPQPYIIQINLRPKKPKKK